MIKRCLNYRTVFCAIKCHYLTKLYSKYQMTDGKPQHSIDFLYIFTDFTPEEMTTLKVLTSISFEKAFETKAGDRLASFSVMQEKHTSGSNRLT